MIRFCDKMVYCINEGDMTRGEMFSFFLRDKERQTDVILVYGRENGEYVGSVTYDTLLFGVEGNQDNHVNTMRVCVGDDFWNEANAYFAKYPKELLTVVNEDGDVLGFAYFEDEDDLPVVSAIKQAEMYKLPILSLPEYQRIKMLVITDLNELAWRCRNAFEKAGLEICVIGEKWEWFGYKSGEEYLDCADFEKLYLYAEGTELRREEKRNVKSRLGNINNNFGPLGKIFLSCGAHMYLNEIRRMIKQGVAVCEISMPLNNEIFYKTKEELEYIVHGRADIFESWRDKDPFISDEEKRLVEKVVGTDVADVLRKGEVDKLELESAHIYKIGDFEAKTFRKKSTKKKIYLLGPCIVMGRGCLCKDTLLASIQRLADKEDYLVVGIPLSRWAGEKWKRVCKNIPICEGDIVIVINNSDFYSDEFYGQKRIDMSYIYNDKERDTLFSDQPIHSNAKGNHILAQEIYENYLKEMMRNLGKKENRFIQKGEILSKDEIEQVHIYVNQIRQETKGMVGSIVMNCNPFTYGHQYLIEYAASKVDWLYIFVVEENRSFFTFEDRMEMVKKGTAHLPNVIVVPSGRFVLSYETMPIYFGKAQRQDAEVDARVDLEIFARHIAPGLHITKRFVGEEPMDKVTNQYNEQMQDIFELFDLELEVIPRKEMDGEVISASRVRAFMKDGRWEEVKALVPKTSFEKCKKYGE